MSGGHQKVTCLAFLGCFGEGGGLEVLVEAGGLFSLAGLDEGSTFDTTGGFFFPDGSSVGPSAGRFTPPIPPTAGHKETIWTACKHGLKAEWRRHSLGERPWK